MTKKKRQHLAFIELLVVGCFLPFAALHDEEAKRLDERKDTRHSSSEQRM